MTTFLHHANAMNSEGMMRPLEQPTTDYTSTAALLATHRTTYEALLQTHAISERAVAMWRAALAERWICEVAALRLYKRVVQRLVDYYGDENAPEVQLIMGGQHESSITPDDLLHDLRRIEAAIALGEPWSLLAARHTELTEVCAALEHAIHATVESEQQRRLAIIDRRAAEEAHRRATQRMLQDKSL